MLMTKTWLRTALLSSRSDSIRLDAGKAAREERAEEEQSAAVIQAAFRDKAEASPLCPCPRRIPGPTHDASERCAAVVSRLVADALVRTCRQERPRRTATP